MYTIQFRNLFSNNMARTKQTHLWQFIWHLPHPRKRQYAAVAFRVHVPLEMEMHAHRLINSKEKLTLQKARVYAAWDPHKGYTLEIQTHFIQVYGFSSFHDRLRAGARP